MKVKSPKIVIDICNDQ